MNLREGNILKMRTELEDPVQYYLPIGEGELLVNDLIGKKVSIHFEGQINCLSTGEKIKKSYNQGYSYRAFQKLACCDICIVKPEMCHYDKGTCREPEWGREHCMKPHIIYLSLSSHVKIGITREKNVPFRWIDQGAIQALPILRVGNRFISGIIEHEISKKMSDKTNWRNMLKNEVTPEDLYMIRDEIFEEYGEVLDDYDAEDLDEEIVEINYPVMLYPEKVKSLSLDKSDLVEGTLQGIKGQYLILDTGVLNIRKHQGYFIKLSWE